MSEYVLTAAEDQLLTQRYSREFIDMGKMAACHFFTKDIEIIEAQAYIAEGEKGPKFTVVLLAESKTTKKGWLALLYGGVRYIDLKNRQSADGNDTAAYMYDKSDCHANLYEAKRVAKNKIVHKQRSAPANAPHHAPILSAAMTGALQRITGGAKAPEPIPVVVNGSVPFRPAADPDIQKIAIPITSIPLKQSPNNWGEDW